MSALNKPWRVTTACNGAGGRAFFDINASRAGPLMRTVIWAKSFVPVIKPSYKTLTLMTVTAFATVVFFAAPSCSRYFVSIHQRDVARQLIEWRSQYSSIRTKPDAIRTAEVLGYIQGYYLPSPGYRGTMDSEQQLNTQREATVQELIAALRTYTKVDCGNDASAWKTAIERQ